MTRDEAEYAIEGGAGPACLARSGRTWRSATGPRAMVGWSPMLEWRAALRAAAGRACPG